MTEDQREVGSLSRRVMLPFGSTLIRPITGRHSLVPASCTRCVIRLSCDLPSERNVFGTQRAYHVPQVQSLWGKVGGVSSPVARRPRARSSEPRNLATYRLVEACQPLWLVLVTAFIDTSHYVHPIPRSWFPTALRLAVAVSAHAFTTLPVGRRLRCPWSFRPLRYQRRRSR